MTRPRDLSTITARSCDERFEPRLFFVESLVGELLVRGFAIVEDLNNVVLERGVFQQHAGSGRAGCWRFVIVRNRRQRSCAGLVRRIGIRCPKPSDSRAAVAWKAGLQLGLHSSKVSAPLVENLISTARQGPPRHGRQQGTEAPMERNRHRQRLGGGARPWLKALEDRTLLAVAAAANEDKVSDPFSPNPI